MMDQMHYLHRAPKTETHGKPPLIILLHGYGSNAEDLFGFAEELPAEAHIVSLQAPYEVPGHFGGFAWFAIEWTTSGAKGYDLNQAARSLEFIGQAVQGFAAEFDCDQNRITSIGFSQGAILSMTMGLNQPTFFKNVVALSGFLHTDTLRSDLQEFIYQSPEGATMNTPVDFPNIYVSHGVQDQVIPITLARKTAPILKQLGVKHKYSEYPVGHGVHPSNFYDMREWLDARL